MKKSLLQFALICPLFFLILCCKTDRNKQADTQTEDNDWTLVFEEEFNDLSAWNQWYGGAFNNEIQLYQPEQLVIEDGILTIQAKREAVNGPTRPMEPQPKDFSYVSGRIESKQLFGPSDREGEREYRILARLKLPRGKGMWPAFWLYGDPWPTKGELDIIEARGHENDQFQSNIIYGPQPGVNSNQHSEVIHRMGQDLTADFHTYEMIWREDSLDILFDGKLLHSYTADQNNNLKSIFGKQQKIVFNTAVGGWFIKDQEEKNYADRSEMQIDWVQVYKR